VLACHQHSTQIHPSAKVEEKGEEQPKEGKRDKEKEEKDASSQRLMTRRRGKIR